MVGHFSTPITPESGSFLHADSQFERRPAGEKLAEHHRIVVVEPLQHLWIVLFQCVTDAIGESYPVSHDHPTLFDQVSQPAHLGALGLKRFEPLGGDE